MIIWVVLGFLLLGVWTAGLTYLFLSLKRHYSSLIGGVEKKNLIAVLDTVLRENEFTKKELATLKKKYEELEKDSKLHIQKVGMVRFNPFKDTGGDQSFIISLLNAENSGIVISGLYSRSGTRWYAKKVKKGEGIEYELSTDEKKALDVAKNND